MMVTGLHEGSRVVTAGVKLHEYLHVVSREVLLGKLPKLDVAGSNPVGRSKVSRAYGLTACRPFRFSAVFLPLSFVKAPLVGQAGPALHHRDGCYSG
jgi:hypothetical protein